MSPNLTFTINHSRDENTFIIFVAELRFVMESTALPLLLRLVHLLERNALRVVVLVTVVHLRALGCDWDIFARSHVSFQLSFIDLHTSYFDDKDRKEDLSPFEIKS